ncbi:MAG TPA: phosphotransferase, partial [Candidatus Limnocylindria bacterium]
LVGRTREALGPLERQAPPAVFEHGDLSHPNLVVRDEGGLGVLDWELARPDGLPLHDLCFFLGYVALATVGEEGDPFEGLVRVLGHPTWGAAAALHSEAARLGIDREAIPGLVIACWARAFAGLADRLAGGAAGGVDGQLSRSRYHRLWEGAVDRQGQLVALLV